MNEYRPTDSVDAEPVEAWVRTDEFGMVVAVTVGVWENPDAWIDVAPETIIEDPDARGDHPPRGDGRV